MKTLLAKVEKLQHDNETLHAENHKVLYELLQTLEQTKAQAGAIALDPKRTSITQDELETLTTNVLNMSAKTQQLSKEQAILSSLDFDQRHSRYEAIPLAHQKTFSWVFQLHEGPSHGDFRDWMKNHDGIFWISGKPGAGKSTLMKFIAGHGITQNTLSDWAIPDRLVVASHYFWSAGTPIQRSQEGLLRSLLFDILRQLPSLTSTVCQARWRSTDFQRSTNWSISELRSCLQILAAQKDLAVKFCFFIDGLDEFEGDHLEICETLSELCTSTYIKMCVASRPWNIFEDSFGASCERKLYIHELTLQDIRAYSESRLHGHPRWRQLLEHSPDATRLVDEITSRAQGVFLWVFLVTRELRAGLTNDDTSLELRRRLESFPTDLDQFFKHMLESVEDFYHEKMAGTIRIAAAAKEPLSSHIYAFHDLEYEDEDYALKIPMKPFNHTEKASFMRPVARRLNGRCRGLIEVNRGRVEFLHRTVRDFLKTPAMADFLRQKSRDNFNPLLSIMRAYLAWIKKSVILAGSGPRSHRFDELTVSLQFDEIVSASLQYASECEDQDGRCCDLTERLLDDLEMSLVRMFNSRRISFNGAQPGEASQARVQAAFRDTLLEKKVGFYLLRKLAIGHHYLPYRPRPPHEQLLQLEFLEREPCEPVEWTKKDMALLGRLLEIEEERRTESSDMTPWIPLTLSSWPIFMAKLTSCTMTDDSVCEVDDMHATNFITTLQSGVFDKLLEHGANGHSLVSGGYPITLPAWARYLLMALAVPHIDIHGEKYLSVLQKMLKTSKPKFSPNETSGIPLDPMKVFLEFSARMKTGYHQWGWLTRLESVLVECSAGGGESNVIHDRIDGGFDLGRSSVSGGTATRSRHDTSTESLPPTDETKKEIKEVACDPVIDLVEVEPSLLTSVDNECVHAEQRYVVQAQGAVDPPNWSICVIM